MQAHGLHGRISQHLRLIEPDTSGIDGSLIQELQPLGQRLGAWVAKVCDG
jgi:hypothetical protein